MARADWRGQKGGHPGPGHQAQLLPLPKGGQACPLHLDPRPGADHPVPTGLALEDLCVEEAESEELEEAWASLLVFIALFLLSVSYGAAVSLCKVGTDAPLSGGAPRQGGPRLGPDPASHVPSAR